MAYQMTAWKMEGKSDVEINNVRFSRKSEIPALINIIITPETNLVTIGRTDKQSNILHEVWSSHDYIDLNERR
jgi:hypothetical protein